MGGAQELYEVTPDLTVLGKAIANGYPISVVTGKKEIMSAAADRLFISSTFFPNSEGFVAALKDRLFISSTFFPNSEGFVAALKTIEILERDKVLENIWDKGNRFVQNIRELLDKYHVGAELTGVGPMFYITFERDEEGLYKKRRRDFYTQLIRKGFFFSPYHH